MGGTSRAMGEFRWIRWIIDDPYLDGMLSHQRDDLMGIVSHDKKANETRLLLLWTM